MSLEEYGFRPTIIQPELTPDQVELLKSVLKLRKMIDSEKTFWNRTQSETTINALAEASGMLRGLSSAICAEDYCLERACCILLDTNVALLTKSIRSPSADSEEMRAKVCNNIVTTIVYIF